MRSLKIAVFHNIAVNGGAMRSFYELVKPLSRRHTVDFYRISPVEDRFFSPEDFAHHTYTFKYQWLYFKKRPFSYLNIFLAFLNLYRLDRTYHRIARAIDKNNYEVAFITFCLISYFTPSLIKYLKTPKVYYCYEPPRLFYEPYLYPVRNTTLGDKISNLLFGPFYKLYNYTLKRNDRKNIEHADLVLCSSYYTKEYINRAYGLLAQVNYLGVDCQKFRSLGIPGENLVISVGHLEPRKAHDFVIKAIAKTPDSIRPKLAIVYPIGSDAEKGYKRYLEDLADKNKVEVLFFERIPDEELVILYNKAKVTTCAHIREPFGLVPLESMACQTPVIAIKDGGFRESIINDETGILVERNITEFAQAIEYLLTNDETRIKMGQISRQHVVENWPWEKSSEELVKNFLEVIKNRNG